MSSILQHKRNVHSQNGEDGIIEYIFNKIGKSHNGTFIEFGAWDGKHLSNTYHLFSQKGWDGIYIESDPEKANDLQNNFSDFKDRIDCVCANVGYSDTDNLDTLIETYSTRREFDFVSIDVDGLDYFIFQKMNKYLPSVICIEVNAGHSPEYAEVIPENIASDNIGQSIYVITEEAKRKGYFALCYTGNLFLVKNEYRELFAADIRGLTDMYIEFLQHLEPEGIMHLKKTFVENTIYNGFNFHNVLLAWVPVNLQN